MTSKKLAKVDKDQCVACGACGNVCPKGAIKVWRGCYAVVGTELCVGCELCAKICPSSCITVEERM